MPAPTLPDENVSAREIGMVRRASHDLDKYSADYLHYIYLIECVRQAGERARGRLLDIGCGNKPYRKLFAQVEDYVGSDIVQSSEKMVDVLSVADNIPLPDQSFDCILCTQTIEHVANHHGLLSEAFRLLKPGGTIFLAGPMYWYHHEEPFDFYRFTSHGFRYATERAGFVVEKIEPNGGKWAMLGLVLLHTLPRRYRGRRFVNRFVNAILLRMDRRYFDPSNTSNFFVVAHRPK